jgi:hypothetical protein
MVTALPGPSRMTLMAMRPGGPAVSQYGTLPDPPRPNARYGVVCPSSALTGTDPPTPAQGATPATPDAHSSSGRSTWVWRTSSSPSSRRGSSPTAQPPAPTLEGMPHAPPTPSPNWSPRAWDPSGSDDQHACRAASDPRAFGSATSPGPPGVCCPSPTARPRVIADPERRAGGSRHDQSCPGSCAARESAAGVDVGERGALSGPLVLAGSRRGAEGGARGDRRHVCRIPAGPDGRRTAAVAGDRSSTRRSEASHGRTPHRGGAHDAG